LNQEFHFRDKSLTLDRSHVMGILNVTPDSFSDGGMFRHREAALTQALQMIRDGAAIIDVGGESTRPGAEPVSLQEEMDRVLPVVELLAKETDTIISVDTSSPELMLEVAELGAHLINDVRALQKPGALGAAAQTGLSVCLMHMQGQPDSMQADPAYQNVVEDVKSFFDLRVQACTKAGIPNDRILLDPGFGFGKRLEHNLKLVNRLPALSVSEMPLLVGMSRKSMIGTVLNKPIEQRLEGTLALTAAAVMAGVFIIRVHDVPQNVDVVRMLNAVRQEEVLD
jgi:dihydropteroate synthase